MADLEFTLVLNSPAFCSAAPRGTRTVHFMQKDRQTGHFNRESGEFPFFPGDPSGIRIPSLRGALGFWLRSLLPTDPPRRVFAHQERILGSARAGQGLFIRPLGRPSFDAGELRFPRNGNAFLYLGYGPLQLVNKPGSGNVVTSFNRQAVREAIQVERARPSFRYRARGTAAQIAELRDALTLLDLFGGVGGRSRRGWGSVEVTIEGQPVDRSGHDPAKWLVDRVHPVLERRLPAGLPSTRPRHSAFCAHTRACVTPVIEGSYEQVLRFFYERFADTRLFQTRTPIGIKDKSLEVRDAGATSISGIPQRLAFGMPYYPKSKHWRGNKPIWEIQYTRKITGEADGERRASPLLLKVHRVDAGRHFGVALYLDSEFFGNPKAEIGAKGKSNTLPPPGPTAIHEYLKCPDWTRVPI